MQDSDFKRLIELAEEWRDFSRMENGWASKTYKESETYQEPYSQRPLRVWCYCSDDGVHALVQFALIHPDEVSVAFHRDPIISINSKLLEGDKLKNLLEQATMYLHDVKILHTRETLEALEQRRERRIQLLQKELEELNQGENRA